MRVDRTITVSIGDGALTFEFVIKDTPNAPHVMDEAIGIISKRLDRLGANVRFTDLGYTIDPPAPV